MQTCYDAALKGVLEHEGGYSNDPGDDGGPTKYGITIWDARSFWKPNATAADVRSMPLSVAKKIYEEKYWDALRCDEMPAGVDYAVFDYGVNSGISRAAKLLQRLLNVSADGKVGSGTLGALRTHSDYPKLIHSICDQRLAFLQAAHNKSGQPLWPLFGRGWAHRVAEVRLVSLRMQKDHPGMPGTTRPWFSWLFSLLSALLSLLKRR